jgi:hypothetical protein
MAWQPETLNYGGGVPVRIFPTVKTPKTATLVAMAKTVRGASFHQSLPVVGMSAWEWDLSISHCSTVICYSR